MIGAADGCRPSSMLWACMPVLLPEWIAISTAASGVRLQCLQQREPVGHADDLSGT